jgi:aromatic-L-amino-acid/L-tryptophan decarboxylase
VNFRVNSFGRSEADVAAANAAIVDALTADGRRWISVTKVNGHSVMRMMVISYLTEERHLHGLQEALTRAASEIMIRVR